MTTETIRCCVDCAQEWIDDGEPVCPYCGSKETKIGPDYEAVYEDELIWADDE